MLAPDSQSYKMCSVKARQNRGQINSEPKVPHKGQVLAQWVAELSHW